jgi:tetratricopeptide (TPR) repeat protein
MKALRAVVCCVLLGLSSAGWADEAPANLQRRVSLELREVTVANLFRILGEVGHQDFRLAPEVASLKATLKFQNVPLQLVLDGVASQLGLEYHRDGSVLVVEAKAATKSSGVAQLERELAALRAREAELEQALAQAGAAPGGAPTPLPDPARALYLEGKLAEARAALPRVGAEAERMRAQLQDVELLLADGRASLAQGAPERAAAALGEALELDARLLSGLEPRFQTEATRQALEREPSPPRKAIRSEMGAGCYAQGKALAQRGDSRRACLVWRQGYAFTRTNVDLLKALTNVCGKRGREALEHAMTCDDVSAASDFAVEGDGLADELAKKRAALHCAAP